MTAKWRLLLAASLVLNCYLVGVVAAGAWRLRHQNLPILAGTLRIAGAELPLAERQQFRATMRQARVDAWPEVERARVAQRRAAALLRASTVDRAAISQALAQTRASEVSVRGLIEDRAIAFAVHLPAADRARLAAAVERRAQNSPPGFGVDSAK